MNTNIYRCKIYIPKNNKKYSKTIFYLFNTFSRLELNIKEINSICTR